MASRIQPVLYVDELTLRPWTAADVPALSAAYADPAIRHWHNRSMTWSEAGQWVSTANRGWASETAANWAVTAKDGLVGRMSLRTVDLEDGLAEIGYWVVPSARGRGIAPRALVAVSNWPSTNSDCTDSSYNTRRGTRHPVGSRRRQAIPWRARNGARPSMMTDGTTCTCMCESTTVNPVEPLMAIRRRQLQRGCSGELVSRMLVRRFYCLL